MITGTGIPSKIRQCGQEYTDVKTGIKYKQNKCPYGNEWTVMDMNSNDGSSGSSTPTNLGAHIYSSTFVVEGSDFTGIESTPFTLLTITNTATTKASITILQLSCVISGTKFTNSPVFRIGSSTTPFAFVSNLNYTSVTKPNANSVIMTLQLFQDGYPIIGGQIDISQQVSLTLESDVALTGGDSTSKITFYMDYIFQE